MCFLKMKRLFLFIIFLQLISSCTGSIDNYKLPEFTPSDNLITELNDSREVIMGAYNSRKRTSFKIQFHGQSVVNGINSKRIKETLERTFESVDFEMINTSRNGFQVPQLLPLMHEDIFPNKANLLFFHAYGGTETGELNQFFKNLQDNFEGDVIIFNHHLSYSDDKSHHKELTEVENLSSIKMEEFANAYKFGFIDVRAEWLRVLDLNEHVMPGDLLRDHVHPNEDGKLILEHILMSHFIKAIEG